jgi:hypothetical protein
LDQQPGLDRIGSQFALFILADKALDQQYSFEEISTIKPSAAPCAASPSQKSKKLLAQLVVCTRSPWPK